MTSLYHTTLLVSLGAGTQHELNVAVEYERNRGYPQTMVDPGCEASVSIARFHVKTDEGLVLAPWLDDLFQDDEELISELMQHWADDDAAAEEYRAEDRAERLRLALED